MEPAQASVEPVDAEAEEAAETGHIPIDLGDVIPAEHKYERISVSAEGMPRGSLLSGGKDNGDETWTLAPEDLPGLAYIPSKKGLAPHLICFRIVGIMGGFGEAIGSVDIKIEPDAVVRGPHMALSTGNAASGFAEMGERFQIAVDTEVAHQLESAKAGWEQDTQRRLAELAEAANDGLDSAQAAELEALVAAAETRVQAAEEAARNATETLGQAIARAESAEAEAASHGMNEEAETLRAQLMAVRRELSGVKASMRVRSGNQEEVQKAVREALDDEVAHQMEELHERYGQELERLTKLAAAGGGAASAIVAAAAAAGDTGDSGDFEARLAQARGEWEREIGAKLASVEAATKKAIIQGREAAVAEARQQWEQELREKLAAAQADWQTSQLGAGPDPQQQQAESEAALQQAIAARDEAWQAELDRHVAEERTAWQAAEQGRLAAAQSEWQSAQPAPGVDEDEIARRIAAAQQEWQEAQNRFIEARDQEWQAELDRRSAEAQAAEHERLAAAAAVPPVSAVAGGNPEDEQNMAAAREEWAQAQTLEIEGRLLEAEKAWQAKDEERLQAAKVGWEAEQQVLIAERDEQWQAELVRQLDEAKEAWRMGVENHTPALEMPAVVAAEDAPVGVTTEGAPAGVAVEEDPALFGEGLGQEVVLAEELPSFFEEHGAETAPDREWANEPDLQGNGAAALQAESDESRDSVPEWVEIWGDRLRIPPHWLPIICRFGRGVSRFSRFVLSKLWQSIYAKKPAAPQAAPAQPGAAQSTVVKAGFNLTGMRIANFRDSKLGRTVSALLRALSKLIRVLLRFVWAVFAKLFRMAVTVGIIVGLYHGYNFAKPYVYPHVKPHITAYWDPYAAPYVTTYWDPYVQSHIDRYWGSYAKPYIVNSWDTYAEPKIEEYWGLTKSVANDGWEGVKALLPDGPPSARVGASVSKGASKAKGSAGKPKLSAVAPRVYLQPPVANLRSGPSKYAALAGTARQGDHIQRLEENGGWVRIRVVAEKIVVGWVHGALLSDKPAR